MPPESPQMPTPEEPARLFTHGAERERFEAYKKNFNPELIDEDFEEVRKEIAEHYQVPPENRRVIADEKLSERKRLQRAFSVVILDSGERHYIDGRTAHAVLMRTLKNTYKVDFDPETEEENRNYVSVHGFLDPDGFEGSEMVQKKSEELKRPITWFVRYTVPSSSSSPVPESPVEIS